MINFIDCVIISKVSLIKDVEGEGVIDMTEAQLVMDNFMKKLAADEYKKENQPNNGPEINADFIEEQVMSYSKLLKSGIIDAVLNE